MTSFGLLCQKEMGEYGERHVYFLVFYPCLIDFVDI